MNGIAPIKVGTALLGAVLLSLGCRNGQSAPGSQPPSEPSVIVASAPASAPNQPEAQAPAWSEQHVVGTWTSGPCAARNYPRDITLSADHSFEAIDKVAPCPPGARCVWSGLVLWRGTWRLASDRIELERDQGAAGKQPQHVAAALTPAYENGQLVLRATEDGAECPYTKSPE